MEDAGRGRTAAGWLRKHCATLLGEGIANIALPLAVYLLARPHAGAVAALLLSSLPPLVWSCIVFVRERRVDALSVLVMIGVGLSLLAFLGGGSVRVLQVREKLVTLLIGLVFLGSAALGRPLVWPLARALARRRSEAELARLDARRDEAGLRRMVMVMTLVWGAGLVAEFAVSVVLIAALPVATYLVVGPVLGYATIGSLAFWTMTYRRRAVRRSRTTA